MDQVDAISTAILQIVKHTDLAEFFEGGVKVLNERSIIPMSGTTLKPDRVLINANKEALLLDYKTGALMQSHVSQVESYATAIEQIGYNVRKKALVYIGSDINVINL